MPNKSIASASVGLATLTTVDITNDKTHQPSIPIEFAAQVFRVGGKM
jgi:hypothetical protein